jgi:hypothetical protein
VTGYYSTHFPHPTPPDVREAPSYFRRGSKHYLITSGTSGYFPNPSEIAVADSYHGPWTVLGDPHPEDATRTSYQSQIGSVFRHPLKKDLYITLADRWLPEVSAEESDQRDRYRRLFNGETAEQVAVGAPASWNNEDTRIADYVWLPIVFDGDVPRIDWVDEWSPDDYE